MAVRDDADVRARAAALVEELIATPHCVRARLDDRVDISAGRRATDWELKGVPLRIELGPRDLAEGTVPLVERALGAKTPVSLDGVAAAVSDALARGQDAMLAEARAALDGAIAEVSTLDEAREASQTGFAKVPWSAVGPQGEAQLASASITVRCLSRPDGSVPDGEDEPDLMAITARAY
jgi:prolyl-tRNA synthetase